MKDITHYFTDTTKSLESSVSDIKDNSSRDQQECRSGSPRKRKRVKIKISRTNSKTRVCDIVESKNDMIDKTPSPFTKANGGKKVNNDVFAGTPKKKTTLTLLHPVERSLAEKHSDRTEIAEKDGAVHVLKERNDKSDTKKTRRNRKHNSKVSITDCCEFVSVKETSLNNEVDMKEGGCSEREESNAFQVLMNSSKPVQSMSPQQTVPEKILSSRSTEDRDKLKKSKEKLLLLANKKGYSKRKLAELHEGERIEKKIENRTKLFKTESKLDEDCQKQLSGNLLNYFSKTALIFPQKDANSSSTIVVKADVHMPNDALRRCFHNDALQIIDTQSRKQLKKMSRVNRGKCTRPQTADFVDNVDEKQVTTGTSRPRWSMKIMLHSSKDEELSGNISDVEICSPKIQKKYRDDAPCTINAAENKAPCDDNKSDVNMVKGKEGTETSITRISRKRKSSSEKINSSGSLGSRMQKILYPAVSCLQNVKEISKCNDTICDKSNEIIGLSDDLENNESNGLLDKKRTGKLAPLFTRKPKSNQAVISARRLLPQADSLENDSKRIDKKDRNTTVCFSPFPLISHVNQYIDNSRNVTGDVKVPMRSKIEFTPIMNVRHFKHILDLEDMSIISVKNVKKCMRADLEEALSDIEAHYTNTRKMWGHVSSVAQMLADSNVKNVSPEGKGKSRRSGNKKGTIEEFEHEASKACDIWTYKYKPLSTEYVIGNQEAAKKLKLWLDGWRSALREGNNSENEFYSSDCSYSSINENNQVAVLIGPHGVGKSASVYAVAEELGYRVIEVNASSKRTGKKILKELEEATKSHRVKKDETKAAFFAINKYKNENKMSEKTLILLDDVDLIFEEDEGFINATYQLVSNTKRPIVMTCRDVYPHLNKMAPQQNKIYFQNVESSSMWALLELICLAETGCRVPCTYFTELWQSGDLRKALLQLQFLLLSGHPYASRRCVTVSKNLWQDMRHCIYKPTIRDTKKPIPKKYGKKSRMQKKTDNAMYDLVRKLDVISVVTTLMDVDDDALDLSNVRVRPSLSLIEDTSPYCVTKSISSDIGCWLRDKIMSNEPIKGNGKPKQNNVLLRKQLNIGVDFALSSVAPLNLDRRAMSIDYLSSVRTICRAEEFRLTMNSKRGNRFFHYLQGLRLPVTSVKPNILSAACKMMQEKMQNDTSTIINIDEQA